MPVMKEKAMRFKDRVVLISGGGSVGPSMSNGRASAIKFAREGARAAVVDGGFSCR